MIITGISYIGLYILTHVAKLVWGVNAVIMNLCPHCSSNGTEDVGDTVQKTLLDAVKRGNLKKVSAGFKVQQGFKVREDSKYSKGSKCSEGSKCMNPCCFPHP